MPAATVELKAEPNAEEEEEGGGHAGSRHERRNTRRIGLFAIEHVGVVRVRFVLHVVRAAGGGGEGGFAGAEEAVAGGNAGRQQRQRGWV